MLQEKINESPSAACQAAPPSAKSRGGWEDYVVPQRWDDFTSEDHAVWDLLFARQVELLGSRVVSPFLDGIDLLRLSHPGVPDVEGLNAILHPRTGWQTVAAQAEAANIPMSSHLFAEASAHMLAVTPTAHWLEYLDFASVILAKPAEIVDGTITARGPGLGLEWNEAAVAKYLILY